MPGRTHLSHCLSCTSRRRSAGRAEGPDAAGATRVHGEPTQHPPLSSLPTPVLAHAGLPRLQGALSRRATHPPLLLPFRHRPGARGQVPWIGRSLTPMCPGTPLTPYSQQPFPKGGAVASTQSALSRQASSPLLSSARLTCRCMSCPCSGAGQSQGVPPGTRGGCWLREGR